MTKAILHLYPTLEFDKDFIVRDDGKGSFIALWKPSFSKPTSEELQNGWDDYIAKQPQPAPTIEEQLAAVKADNEAKDKELREQKAYLQQLNDNFIGLSEFITNGGI
jgi:hypothetical protein